MALRNIVKDGDEVLRKVCRPVTEFNERLHVLLDDMKETVLAANGSGLAAVQVGVLKRIFVININGAYLEFINPEIIKQSGEQHQVEGCLSVKMPYGYVKRPMHVTVKALDRSGNEFTFSGTDYTAIALCHEYDHLDGIIYTDKCERFLKENEN